MQPSQAFPPFAKTLLTNIAQKHYNEVAVHMDRVCAVNDPKGDVWLCVAHSSYNLTMKKVSESRSILSEVMLPSHANPGGTVHGGEIMKIMDSCGGVATKRHSRKNIATVRVDELVFYEPIHVGELVICEAQLVFVGHTSMEVQVIVKVENLNIEQPARTALTAFFTYVALGKDGRPSPVPRLKTQTPTENALQNERSQKYEERKKAL